MPPGGVPAHDIEITRRRTSPARTAAARSRHVRSPPAGRAPLGGRSRSTPDVDDIASSGSSARGPTQAQDQGQRYLPFPFTRTGATVTTAAPPRPAEAPPGYCMLFTIGSDGAPRVAPIVSGPAPDRHHGRAGPGRPRARRAPRRAARRGSSSESAAKACDELGQQQRQATRSTPGSPARAGLSSRPRLQPHRSATFKIISTRSRRRGGIDRRARLPDQDAHNGTTAPRARHRA